MWSLLRRAVLGQGHVGTHFKLAWYGVQNFTIKKTPKSRNGCPRFPTHPSFYEALSWKLGILLLLLGDFLIVTTSVQIFDRRYALLYSVYTPKSGAGNLSGSESRF